MIDSILLSVRSICGVADDDDSFDSQLLPLINAQLLDIVQIGVGNDDVIVTGVDETWSEFNPLYPELTGPITTIVGLGTKLIFDPPSSGMATESINKQIDRAIWRVNVAVSYKKSLEE